MSDYQQIDDFDDSRSVPGQQARVERTRAAAETFRGQMLAGPRVRYFRSFDLIKVPYPASYGLRNAIPPRLIDFIHIQNRVFVVQFDTPAGVKTMLASPTDHESEVRTPFFRRLEQSTPKWLLDHVVKRQATVPQILERIGLLPEEIDYITYDHLHTQDLRRWLGTEDEPAFFPNARLLVHRREWESVRDLNPYQADWYYAGGAEGVPEERVIPFEGSIKVGDGVALIHTPGHTEGNHSIVVHADEGLWVISENGVSVDAYAPHRSRIKGVAKYAETIGSEVILNGNTLESSIDQYISMVQEKTIAGPSARDPRFPNVFPSSELTGFWMFPGIKPSFTVGQVNSGEPVIADRCESADHAAVVDRQRDPVKSEV